MAFFKKNWQAASVFAALFIHLYLFAPGILSKDSLSCLCQATENYFQNWHPPFFIYLFRISNFIIKGPVILFTLNYFSMILGVYLILNHSIKNKVLVFCLTLFVGLYPPIAFQYIDTSKDASFASLLVLSLGLIITRFKWSAWILFLLFVAVAIRFNGFVVILPVLFFFRQVYGVPLKKFLLLLALIPGLAFFLNNFLLLNENQFPQIRR